MVHPVTRCEMLCSLSSQTSKICPKLCQLQRLPKSLVCITCETANGSFSQHVQPQVMVSTKASIGCLALFPRRNEAVTFVTRRQMTRESNWHIVNSAILLSLMHVALLVRWGFIRLACVMS